MFFVFSKILAFLITPIVWIVLLLSWGLLTKNEKRKKYLLRLTLILILFFSNNFIFDEMVRCWELPATEYKEVKKYQYGIVLGGMSSYDPAMQRAQFYRGVDRLIQTVELYRKGIIKKIIFTGGSGSILHPEQKEGNYINRYLLYMGIPKEDFLIESESQNTRENATLTKKMLDEKNIKGDFLLITSAFHMRRSLGCFRKVGLSVDPYSTDRYSGPRKFEFDHLIIPNISAMYDWTNIIHEIVGYVTYKLSGYLK
ncbi:MAG: hypothetical protein K0S44_1539 [Bacteroidetes bacterium]|nr:hypothetical protein [Bacteroidota bacterium]